ncbi:MAG: hypothetical protein WCV81_01190 [Microgenomates group bacterium]|jgi:hypothetical protein
MSNYNIAFIDDDQGVIDDFLVTAGNKSVDVQTFELSPDKESLVDEIAKSNVDAIVIDFHLADTRPNIKYDGAEVMNQLEEVTYNIPKFIFTAFSSAAEDKSNDINIVYEKEGDFGPFIDKVIKQIDKYKHRLEEYQEELMSLIEKSKTTKLNVEEEERALELDNIIEKSLNKRLSLPDSLKKPSTISTLDKLLSEAEQIVKELQNRNNAKS